MAVPSSRSHLHAHDKSFGAKAADAIVNLTGSWRFVGGYLAGTLMWCLGNVGLFRFDGFPFAFYTFAVSVLAILLSSLILMAGNRQAAISEKRDNHEADEVEAMFAMQKQQIDILIAQNDLMEQQHAEMLERLGVLQSPE